MRFLIFLLTFLFAIPCLASNYHVMAITNDGSTNQVTVVFHIPIPIENNSGSHSLRDALSEYIGGANFESVYPGTLAGELIQLQNGELYEYVETVQMEDSDTNGQKQTAIDNMFTVLLTLVLNKTRNILEFWGLDRDVP